jgi:iron complex outermembrane receptor protein
VNNVFNAEYESNAYGGNWFEDGIEKTWAYYFPQAGTNFMVRFGLKF